MRQRIAIAIALMCEPRVLIADEPTTALDVTVQAGILRLLDRLRREKGMSVVLITHDLGVMSSIAERMSVLYAGRVVEQGDAPTCSSAPEHPYTRALLASLPTPGVSAQSELQAIPGTPASPLTRRPAARSTRAARWPCDACRTTYRPCSRAATTPPPASSR